MARALDVLNLPLPGDDAENVVACFDPAGILTDLLVLYRTRQSERVPQPGQLAHYLEESVPPRQVQTVTHDGLTRRRYTLPAGVWEAALTPHNFAVGAVVRFSDGQPAGSATLPRTLGDVQLDQSFEQNRLRIALHQQGNPLVLENADDLKHVANPVPGLTLTQAALHRADPHDLPARLALQWTAEQKAQRSLAKLAVPLFAVAGTPHIEAGGGPEGQLTLSWQDARTRWTLRLPNKVEIGPSLEVADRTPPDQLARTAATVREREAAERRQRITAGTPRQRLNREVEGVALGQGRTAVTARFPADDQAAVLALPDVLAVRFLRPAVGGLVWQELEARFDADKKVAEVRFRFRDGSGKAGAVARKLETFKQKYGAPQVLPAPWATVWSARGKAVLYRWQDDTTVVTWQQDGSGVELTVRDCPAAHPAGVPLPPLTVLARPRRLPPGRRSHRCAGPVHPSEAGPARRPLAADAGPGQQPRRGSGLVRQRPRLARAGPACGRLGEGGGTGRHEVGDGCLEPAAGPVRLAAPPGNQRRAAAGVPGQPRRPHPRPRLLAQGAGRWVAVHGVAGADSLSRAAFCTVADRRLTCKAWPGCPCYAASPPNCTGRLPSS